MSSVPPPLVNKLLHLRCSTLLSTVLWNGSLVRCLSHRPRSDMELGEKAVMNLTGLANPTSLGNPSSGPFPRGGMPGSPRRVTWRGAPTP